MDIPKDFQFTDNTDVNAFAVERAEMIFGKDWRNRSDLQISHPFSGAVSLADNTKDGWGLQVEARGESSDGQHIVLCLNGGKLSNPSANQAATIWFDSTAKPLQYSHFASNIAINPPDGTPSQVVCGHNGRAECWYVSPQGKRQTSPASQAEIDERISAANHSAANALCNGAQEIVALQTGSAQFTFRGKSVPSASLQRV